MLLVLGRHWLPWSSVTHMLITLFLWLAAARSTTTTTSPANCTLSGNWSGGWAGKDKFSGLYYIAQAADSLRFTATTSTEAWRHGNGEFVQSHIAVTDIGWLMPGKSGWRQSHMCVCLCVFVCVCVRM